MYQIVIIIICLNMISHIVQLAENESLRRKEKKYLTTVAFLIIFGAICEFFGEFLNGVSIDTRILHGVVKAIEFSISPVIPVCYCFMLDFGEEKKIIKKIIQIFLMINVVLEGISVHVPFIFYINQDNVYVRGKYYILYVLYYIIGIVFFFYTLFKTLKKYQNKNMHSLISIILFLVIGFSFRIFNSKLHTDWLIVTMLYSSFMVYYNDISLKVDNLTSLLNRRSYDNQLRKIDYNTAVIRMDVNNFKTINDTYGHQCGDKYLKIIATTILKVYGKVGLCYRVGGDEFDIILKEGQLKKMAEKEENHNIYKAIDSLNLVFDQKLAECFEKSHLINYGVSKGYGIFYESDSFRDEMPFSSDTIKEVVQIADQQMYENKKNNKITR